MITYISADYIYPVSSPPIKNGVVGVHEDGSIAEVFTFQEAVARHIANVKVHKGILVPGFINTHCHLELSHLRNKVERKTGLPTFIKQILALRAQSEGEVISTMIDADQEMFNNGIVAVGDISNLSISKSVKLNSKIYYHTFVEVLGFNRPSAPIIEAAMQLKNEFSPLKASIVPHAPYSVSADLFNAINKVNSNGDILTIHNQETKGENELFETGTGAFADLFSELRIEQTSDHNQKRNSLQYYLPLLNKEANTLLVHNTFSNKDDIDFAKSQHQKLYWCLCPNANLYIENVLPDVDLMVDEQITITIGTDSLASNHQLNILSEMKTLQRQKGIPFDELLKWATLNGALFLDIEDRFGSIEKGKTPGLNLIQVNENFQISDEQVLKII